MFVPFSRQIGQLTFPGPEGKGGLASPASPSLTLGRMIERWNRADGWAELGGGGMEWPGPGRGMKTGFAFWARS